MFLLLMFMFAPLASPFRSLVPPSLLSFSRSLATLPLSASKTGPLIASSSPSSPSLTLYTKESCGLCDTVLETLLSISSSGGADFSLSAVDITDAGNEDLLDRYKHDIPVVHKEGAYWFKHRLPFDGDGERIAREIEREGVNPVGSKPDASRLSKPKSTSSKTSTVTIPLPGYKTTYTVLTPGSGSSVTKGRTVTVHATGVVKETGEKFWSTKDAGQVPFTYAAGVGAVITGW